MPANRRVRALALAALLLAPLLVGEAWLRGQLDLLYPYLVDDGLRWGDAKLLILDRAGCPEVLGLGSSVTNRTLAGELVRGKRLTRQGRPVERAFTFGLNAASMTTLQASWNGVRRRGCVPSHVFVEVLPGLFNARDPNPRLLEPFLDVRMLARLPDGFVAEAGLDTDEVFEAVTWGRLLLYRQRDALRSALVESAGLRPFSGSDTPVPLDGMILPLGTRRLVGPELKKERRKRLRWAEEGRYDFAWSEVQTQALRDLVADAREAGARVVLHTPPVTGIYREIVGRSGAHGDLCRLWDELGGDAELPWHWAYRDEAQPPADFMDWVHLNRWGGERYAERMFAALRAGRPRAAAFCGGA